MGISSKELFSYCNCRRPCMHAPIIALSSIHAIIIFNKKIVWLLTVKIEMVNLIIDQKIITTEQSVNFLNQHWPVLFVNGHGRPPVTIRK